MKNDNISKENVLQYLSDMKREFEATGNKIVCGVLDACIKTIEKMEE